MRLTVVVAAFGTDPAGDYGARVISGMTNPTAGIDAAIYRVDLRQPEARKRFYDSISEGSVDGVVLLSIVNRDAVCRALDRSAVPVVLADHHFPDLPVSAVIDDSEAGARQAVQHLISLGHRRIAYLEITNRDWNPWRYEGYSGSLLDAGIGVDDALIEPAANFLSALEVTNKLLSLPDPPTAIFAFDDIRAWGAWNAIESHGFEVGRDIAVVGYGDKGHEGGPMADLTSVYFSPQKLGQTALEELASLIRNESIPGKLIKLPTELKIRKSSAEVRPESHTGGLS